MKKNVFLTLPKLHLDCRHLWSISILSLLAVFIIIGCTKQEAKLQDDLPVLNNITFHNGRLIFKDDASFMDHQKWLFENQGNLQLIAEKNKSFGLKSMTEYYLEGMKLEEDDPKFSEFVSKHPSVFCKELYDNSTLYVLPHSIILCYVANEDGIFQVGDQIYRIVQNYIYQTGDESKVEMLFLPKDQISTSHIKITLSQPGLESKSDLGQKTENFHNDNRFRIVSSVRNNIFGSIRYYDIFTNPQKRTLGIYFRAQLNTKAANDDGYYNVNNCPSCPQQSIPSSSIENTGYSQNVIAMLDPIYEIALYNSYCPAYSRGRLSDGTLEYIYISWVNALVNSPTAIVTHTAILNDPY